MIKMIFRYNKHTDKEVKIINNKDEFYNMLHKDLNTDKFKIINDEVECAICPWIKCVGGEIYLIAQRGYGVIGISDTHIKELK